MPYLLGSARLVAPLLLSASMLLGAAQTPTSISLGSSPNPSTFGQAVTLTATIVPGAVTGNVTFYDGATILGTSKVASGQAALTTTLLASGSRSLTAYYGGDINDAPSASLALAQVVVAVPSAGLAYAGQYTAAYGSFDLTYSVATGDFNGDGKTDVVVSSLDSATVAVFLGNGDGTFQAGVSYVAGTNPNSIAVGDFNGDGKPDIAVANAAVSAANGISVLLGKGDGTFQPPVNYATGTYAYSVAVADFNRDGIADLVVANGGSDSISVLLGKGDGTFQAPADFAIASPQYVAVGDLNGDGKPDLVTVLYYSDQVSVMLGNGDGTFQPAVSYPTGVEPTWVVVGDLNGDGKLDLASANQSSNDVSVLLGNGDGTFQTMVSYNVGNVPGSLALGDFNGDGKPDLAFGGLNGNLAVLLGNGDGTFGMSLEYAAANNLWPIVAGDFNGDGKTDVAVGNYAGGFLVFLGSALAPSTTTLPRQIFATYGQPVNLTATVAPGLTFSPMSITGAVQFLDGPSVLGTSNLTNGTATFTATGLAAGPHTIFAAYLGNATTSGSTSLPSSLTITGGPQWAISKTHLGNFTQGQTASYTITATNVGLLPTSGTVSITDTPPNGITVLSLSGPGWTCSGQTCTRSGGLIAGSAYPPITVSAIVAASAQTPLTNVATVSGGGAVPVSTTDQATIESAVAPFGSFDTPLNNTTGIAGAVAVTGWALSGVGIQSVNVFREPVPGEYPNVLVFLGTADIIAGARPDVARAYPGYPNNNNGFGFQILTNELPNSNGQSGVGNGTYNLHVLITDNAGAVTDLGTRTITVNNAASILPFGTIDTPAQGGIASGTAYANFGWALTPQPNIIPIDGSTIWVFIDNLPVGHPIYNNYRNDIGTLFPNYRNSQGAVGYYYLDTTKLTNGLHTISWSATDSAGNTQGLGSRFFTVQN